MSPHVCDKMHMKSGLIVRLRANVPTQRVVPTRYCNTHGQLPLKFCCGGPGAVLAGGEVRDTIGDPVGVLVVAPPAGFNRL